MGGGGVEWEMLQLWGTRQHNSISHVGEECGGVGVQAVGAAHSGIVIRGGGMQLIRLREMDHSPQILPLGSLDTKHSCCCVVV